MTHSEKNVSTYAAFLGYRLVARGELASVLAASKAAVEADPRETLLVFEDATGKQLEFDLRGSLDEVMERACPGDKKAGPGRPKLGVVSREISLLPRHWEWLEQDPRGISAAIRRLVDEERKRDGGKLEAKLRLDAVSKFMWSLAGNLPGFEEASRALFARERQGFIEHTSEWPKDVKEHLARLTSGIWNAD